EVYQQVSIIVFRAKADWMPLKSTAYENAVTFPAKASAAWINKPHLRSHVIFWSWDTCGQLPRRRLIHRARRCHSYSFMRTYMVKLVAPGVQIGLLLTH